MQVLTQKCAEVQNAVAIRMEHEQKREHELLELSRVQKQEVEACDVTETEADSAAVGDNVEKCCK